MIFDKAAAVLRRDILMSFRYRTGLFMKVIAPAAQLIMFYYLARAVGPQYRPDGMSYFVFLLVGTGFYTFLLSCINGFFQIVQESQQTGTLEVLMTTATPAPILLWLSALSAFGGSIVQLLLYTVGGLLIFRPHVFVNGIACAAVGVLSVLIAAAIGMFAAGLQIAVHKGSAVLWLLGSSAWVLAGTLFPVSVLPRPVQVLAQLMPITHALNGMRLALLPQAGAALVAHEIQALSLFCVLLLPASLLFLSWTLRRARQLGTLSYY